MSHYKRCFTFYWCGGERAFAYTFHHRPHRCRRHVITLEHSVSIKAFDAPGNEVWGRKIIHLNVSNLLIYTVKNATDWKKIYFLLDKQKNQTIRNPFDHKAHLSSCFKLIRRQRHTFDIFWLNNKELKRGNKGESFKCVSSYGQHYCTKLFFCLSVCDSTHESPKENFPFSMCAHIN